jgi:Leucine-rich repeat (LRR) protein
MFPHLRALNLSQNYLTDIPPCMMPPSLVTIDVCNNFLAELPNTLVSVPKLRNLFVDDNKICSLPAWIMELEELRRFSFVGNPILPSPQQKQLAANVQMSINVRERARQGDFRLIVFVELNAKCLIVTQQMPVILPLLRKSFRSKQMRG